MRRLSRSQIASILSSLFLISGGLFSVFNLPVELMPSCKDRYMAVKVKWFGVGPERIERVITSPLEKSFMEIPGIESIESVSRFGESKIYLKLRSSSGKSYVSTLLQIKDRIERIKASWPREVQEPEIIKERMNQKPVMFLALSSDVFSSPELLEWAKHYLKPLVERIQGVSTVEVVGSEPREVKVLLDPEKLKVSALSPQVVLRRLRDENFRATSGSLLGRSGLRLPVQVGKFLKLPDVKSIFVRGVELSALASVRETQREPQELSHVNGRRGVMLFVYKSQEGNMLHISRKVRELIAETRTLYPGVSMEVVEDSSEFVRSALANLFVSGLLGVLLVSLSVSLFMALWDIPYVLFSIPFSISGTLIILKLSGGTINTATLGGMLISAGILIDSSVIALEDIKSSLPSNHGEFSGKLSPAAFRALLSGLLTTLAIFVPFFVFGDRRAVYMNTLVSTVLVSLVFSLFYSLFVLPGLVSVFGAGGRRGNVSFASFKFWGKLKEGFAPERYLERFFKLMNRRRKFYFIVLTLFISLLGFLSFIFSDKMWLDEPPSRIVTLYLELPLDTPLDVTESVASRVESEIMLNFKDELESITSRIQPSHAELYIRVRESVDPDRFSQKLPLIDAPMGSLIVSTQKSSGEEKEIRLIFLGKDVPTLYSLATKSAEELQSSLACDVILHFKGFSRAAFIVPKRRVLPLRRVAETLELWLKGVIPTKLRRRGSEEDVRVAIKGERLLDEVHRLFVGGVPFSEEVNWYFENRAPSIRHFNSVRSASIGIRLDPTSRNVRKVATLMNNFNFPRNYYYIIDPEIISRLKSTTRTAVLAVLAVFLSLMLALFFLEDFVALLRITFALLPSVSLPVIIMFVLQRVITTPFIISLALVFGISINSMLLIYEVVRFRGVSFYESALSHLRAVATTVLTTVAGFVPFLFSKGAASVLWFPVALPLTVGVLTGGLLSLTLFPLLMEASQ